MTIAVVDSGGANIASVLHALRRLGTEPVFTADHEKIKGADRVILPGVGSAESAMQKLRDRQLTDLIPTLGQPVLGVCLGMQLLFEKSEEGDTPMLGIIPGCVIRFPEDPAYRVPHMGWNSIRSDQYVKGNPDLNDKWFYFVHSYMVPTGESTMATAEHGVTFSAMVRQDNFIGAQFHPERSARAGSQLLQQFIQGTL